jgi:hypothetical protein
MSASRELSPDWVLSSFIHSSGNSRHEIMELADAARRLWPGVQAHARKEQPGKTFDEAIALATEVWEGVLQSVAKTLQRSDGVAPGPWRLCSLANLLGHTSKYDARGSFRQRN